MEEKNSSSEIGTTQKQLEAFVLDNTELEHLEDLLNQVNFFEAVGADRAENRHSDFLAFLLDPSESHGLGESFLRRFLQRAITADTEGRSPLSAIELDVCDLSDSTIRREYGNIDIFIINEKAGFAAIIENKVDSDEHDDQLLRYRQLVARRHPSLKVLCLFLTVDGTMPTHAEYIPTSYSMVCGLVEDLLKTRATRIDSDVSVLLRHYASLLRRHFMEIDDLRTLARQIYEKHRRALDFIIAQRPDLQADIADILRNLVATSSDLVIDYSTKGATAFVPKEWDKILDLLTGTEEWSPHKRLLLFWFENAYGHLRLKLTIGQGDEKVRAALFEACKSDELLKPAFAKLYGTATIWVKPFLRKGEMDELDSEQIQQRISKTWDEFKISDIPRIKSRIEQIMTKSDGIRPDPGVEKP